MAYRPTDATRQRAAEKRAGFLRAARELVAAHGFAGAKVAAIAHSAGGSTGSLYLYFDSRDELLAEVFRDAAARELAAVRHAVTGRSLSPAQRPDGLVDTFVSRALRSRQMAWSLLFEPVSTQVEIERLSFRRAYIELGEDIVRHGVSEGSFVSQNPTLAASALMGAISESLVGRLNPIERTDLSAMSDEVIVAEIRSFCTRALGCDAPKLRCPSAHRPANDLPPTDNPTEAPS